ncbi:MAG: hypothetical protein HKN45_00820 [Flavobacteriales bacterium]|nr:hypothetical protein [Flavobacteriales bacterium]
MSTRDFTLRFIYTLVLTFISLTAYSQANLRDSVISMYTIDFSAGLHTPSGDISERFGGNGFIGSSFHYKTGSNWVFGIEGGFIFGNNVKEDVASGIRTSEGFVIDQEGNFTELLLLQRGMSIVGTVGKVIPLFGPNPNSGLVIRLGGGLLQHNIRLESRNNDVPQLEGEYLKGYDRLSNGFSVYQFIGYQYLGNQRLVNLTIGFEGYQAFTRSRRDYNFDLMARDDKERFDALYGLKVSWSFPIYKRLASRYYR